MTSSFKILVVEDDTAIAKGIIFNLKRKGYIVSHATDGRHALNLALKNKFDLILLDIRLPEIDGFTVCQELRRQKILTPILIITARDQQDDIIFGLKSGADDYITKPFDLGELLARVESFARRKNWQNETPILPEQKTKWHFGNYWIDFHSWRAKTKAGEIELTKKEIDVMRIFYKHPNEVISRKELLKKVWRLPNHPNERIVDNIIVSLRKHFEQDTQNPRFIVNVWGVGYRFEI